ncbi:Sodium:solute symporter family [Popillia japonica]|uniref:Sodium:solute symporter family n=1 Tax=Popillia japonica TaxID=7064 RepID=A0AAW1KRK3_POPJA
MFKTFSWFDYFLFVFMLILSALIGIYYGFFKQQKTATDYLMGGKNMKVWPVAMSMVTSQLSALILISLPADTYRYGLTFSLTIPLMIVVSAVAYYVYLPVFYKLEVTSIYEYLNLRFNNTVRIYASLLFTIHMLLYTPIVVYVPALALGQVTGISIHYITPVVCGVCIFYTTLGGMKAMVKTDTIQFGIMLSTLTVVVILGIISAGGLGEVFQKSYDTGRLHISFDTDITKRDTFWTCTLGAFFMMTNHFSCSQSFVQKCLSLPTYKSIKSVLILQSIGIMVVKLLCIGAGLVIFTIYSDCDPFETKAIKNLDELLPMYVMDVASFIPGFSGLFLSGIFSAALSGLSASLNCLAATIYQDFVSPFIPKSTTQERVSLYLKVLVVILGVLAIACVFIVEKLGGLLALTFSLLGITGGPLLGLFSIGMLAPTVNSKGALCGGITSLIVTGWIITGSLWYKMKGIITYPTLLVFTHGCNETILTMINVTFGNQSNANMNDNATEQNEPLILYRISFYWFVGIGVCIVFAVGIIVSYFTEDDKPLNRDCISPVVQFLLKQDEDEPPKYDTIEKAKRTVTFYSFISNRRSYYTRFIYDLRTYFYHSFTFLDSISPFKIIYFEGSATSSLTNVILTYITAVKILEMQVATFTWLDYFFFALMLISSALVGVYYGFVQKQNTADDYLLGGKRMNIWPTAMSIVSSTLSGFTLLSIPADVYKHGVTYGFIIFACVVMGIASYFFLPLFYKLQITSVYEYLGVRFNNKVRILGSLLYAIYMILFLPIVIYIPALALGQVTNLNVHLITPVVCVVCIFYTTLGGLKAVIWTDAIQFGVMLGSMIVVIVVGLWNEGGFQNVLKNASEGGRLDIRTLILAVIGICLIKCLSVFSGLLMFSTYKNCDPIAANSINSSDQILPFYVMQQINFIPGVCGLFISGIFSAGLSTFSAVLNCLAATIYEDFISPFIRTTSMGLVYIVEKLGGLAPLTIAFAGVTSGPILGLFFMGMLLPQITSTGALTGGIASLCIMSWVIMTAQWYKAKGLISYSGLPLSVKGCNYSLMSSNETLTTITETIATNSEEPLAIYRVSFYWYAAMGFMVTVIVAVVVSCFTKEDKPLNKDCISPVIQLLLTNNKSQKYDVIDTTESLCRCK